MNCIRLAHEIAICQSLDFERCIIRLQGLKYVEKRGPNYRLLNFDTTENFEYILGEKNHK